MKRIKAMAKTLEVSERYVSELIARGVFPVHRLGKIVFLDPEEVYAAIRRQGSKPPTEEAPQTKQE